ncbi:MAG: phosphoribosylformylglycinamidine synthase subunit PurS [Bacteroidota bacterium]
MKYSATIYIMPRPEILDPQGKATLKGLSNLGFDSFEGVRIGKRIELVLSAANEEEASNMVQEACKKLLANTVIEEFTFELKQLAEVS